MVDMTDLIEAHGVTKFYDEYCALKDVSLRIGPGEFVSIIGPNGAGKTTLVNVLTGLLKPTSGTIRFKGNDIAGVGPVRLSGVGMARSFQLVNVFPQLTVRETIAVAVTSRLNLGNKLFASLGGNRAVRDNVDEIAALFGLVPKLGSLAISLSQGDKKLLDVASAFALRPEIILMDEPTSGVSTADKNAVMKVMIDASRTMGVKAIIQIEHDMDMVFGYSTRIIALHQGQVLADTTPAGLRADKGVMATVTGAMPS